MTHIASPRKRTTIPLPKLEIAFKHPLGLIKHVLEFGGERTITATEDFRASSRTTERVITLSDGIRILVTKRKKLDLPVGIDGAIRHLLDGSLQWVRHRKSDVLRAEIEMNGLGAVARRIADGWSGKFNFRQEVRGTDGVLGSKGLRPPQIGGLHAIGAHWSLYRQPATVVMPTGTGKTETMLAAMVAFNPGPMMVVVPSRILRDQAAGKFLTLGLLRTLGNLSPDAPNPLVGIVTRRPRKESELDIFANCNVVVTTMSAVGEESGNAVAALIPKYAETLVVDEAHHIGAVGWSAFREHFKDRRVLQFTATPYRRDGKLVDGKVIYEYPLHRAQQDGYFKRINFESVYEIDQDDADEAVATKALECLKADLGAGKDHLLMARCASIDRAQAVHSIYGRLAPELSPVLVHSEGGEADQALSQLADRRSRVVVCVNMLGEGFDLPQLKVAAVHDTHKSLAILLQFTGRFTRSAGDRIGDATVVANIADQEVSAALERLYSEDADWNQLLSEFSSEAAKSHSDLIQFLNSSKSLDESEDDEKVEVSHHLLRPVFNTVMYDADSFTPKKFIEGIPDGTHVHRVWTHEKSRTLYFVTRFEPLIKWTRSRKVRDRVWDLFVLHYDEARGIIYISSSDKSSTHEKLAKAVGGKRLISGDVIFRSLGKINRLIFQNVGVRKHGRRNLRFAMYTGADVAEALSISERAGSVKSNLSGTGWENGSPITIGCSYKGRVWARDPGSVLELVQWCESVGEKIRDGTIDTARIIANVLIPEEVTALPDKKVLSIEWPIEIVRQSEERVVLQKGGIELPVSMFDIDFVRADIAASQIEFCARSSAGDVWVALALKVGGPDGFTVQRASTEPVTLRVGSLDLPIEQYFSSYPPLIRFVDVSELDGNLLIKPQNAPELRLPDERFKSWEWAGVDIRKESIWKDGAERRDSIQWRVAQQYITDGFDVVFDDDSAGEAADLVCLKEEADHIHLALIHCKFTKGTDAGERVKDVVEVSSQAVRCAKWKWKFKDLCKHILAREKRLGNSARPTRFLNGKTAHINKYVKLSRFKEIRPDVIIVQPGLSKSSCTADQTSVLAAAYSYLKETIGVDLDIVCSA